MAPQMVSLAALNTSELKQDDVEEVVAAIEEIIAEFGIRAFVGACLRSQAGEEFKVRNEALRVTQFILREIAFSKNPQLEAEIMALGAGIILNDGDSMRGIARKHGVSPATISKRVIKFCDENHLPPSIFMKTKKDRETYALTNQPRS